jgi:alpha-glucosidase
LGAGRIEWLDGLGDDVIAFRSTGLATITVVSNLGTRPIALPAGNPLVHSERPWPDAALSELSPNTTIWMTDADGRPINQA